MTDFKSKIPSFKEVVGMTSKLFKDISNSVGEIVKDYQQARPKETTPEETVVKTEETTTVVKTDVKPAKETVIPAAPPVTPVDPVVSKEPPVSKKTAPLKDKDL